MLIVKQKTLVAMSVIISSYLPLNALAIERAISIANVAEYADKEDVDADVLKECLDLNQQFAKDLNENLKEEGFITTILSSAVIPKTGQYLDVKLLDVISDGNAFLGHRKTMRAKATLYQNNVVVETRKISDTSNGGFGGGFKGSCSVLGGLSDDLSEKVVDWLKDMK